MNEQGFAKLRNGLRDHIKKGRLSPQDLGVYTYLHFECDWQTGIYHGSALGIAWGFDDPGLKDQIKRALGRLRAKGYINFRRGDGTRKGYDILINKFDPQFGNLSGKRLNAWKNGDKVIPVYEEKPEAALKPPAARPEPIPETALTPDLPDLPALSEGTEVSTDIQPTSPAEPDKPREKTPAETLAVQFFKALGQPKKFRLAAGEWEKSISVLLENFTTEELSSVIKFALEENPFTLEYLNIAHDPMATFVKNIDSIRQSWETEQKVVAARAKKAAKTKSDTKVAPGAHGNKSGFQL